MGKETVSRYLKQVDAFLPEREFLREGEGERVTFRTYRHLGSNGQLHGLGEAVVSNGIVQAGRHIAVWADQEPRCSMQDLLDFEYVISAVEFNTSSGVEIDFEYNKNNPGFVVDGVVEPRVDTFSVWHRQYEDYDKPNLQSTRAEYRSGEFAGMRQHPPFITDLREQLFNHDLVYKNGRYHFYSWGKHIDKRREPVIPGSEVIGDSYRLLVEEDQDSVTFTQDDFRTSTRKIIQAPKRLDIARITSTMTAPGDKWQTLPEIIPIRVDHIQI